MNQLQTTTNEPIHRGRKSVPIPVSAGAAAPDSSAMIHLLGNTLRLWWFWAILLGLLAATFAALAVYHTFEPKIKASMWLRIYSDAPYIVFQNKGGSEQFVENQTQLIRSRLVLGPLLSDPDIAALKELENAPDKIEALAQRLVVSPVGRSEYFAVQYEGIDETTSKRVVQRVVDSYMTLQNSDESRQRQDVVSLLESEKEIREQKVEELRKSLSQLVKDSAVVDDEQAKVRAEQMASLTELRKRLVTLDVESAILKIEIEAFKNSAKRSSKKPNGDNIKFLVADHPEVRSLQREIDELEDSLRSSKRIGRGHPTHKRIRAKITTQESRMKRLRQSLAEQQIRQSQMASESNIDETLQTMSSRLASYEITRKVVESHIASDTGAIKKNSGDSLQVEFLRAELNQATEVHDLIARRLLALKTEQRAPARVQTLDSGGLSAVPVELMPYKKMAMASAGAFAIPLLLLLGIEALIQRVSTTRQLESGGRFHVIAEISTLPNIGLIRHVRRKRWRMENQLYRESVDQLRACLTCQENKQNAQVLVVASAVSGEGKTSLALQLSSSLMQSSGKRVLLIDGDLRYPKVHQWAECDLSPGLSDVLHYEATEEVLDEPVSWRTVVHRPEVKGRPYYLTAGELLASPHRLFGGKEFKRLLVQLRRHYHYIIIDTPPILSASEAMIMSAEADAVLLCVRCDRSRMEYVQSAQDRLQLAGAKAIGTVLTGVPFKSYSSKYGIYAYPES